MANGIFCKEILISSGLVADLFHKQNPARRPGLVLMAVGGCRKSGGLSDYPVILQSFQVSGLDFR
jgi:hypothetical protein